MAMRTRVWESECSGKTERPGGLGVGLIGSKQAGKQESKKKEEERRTPQLEHPQPEQLPAQLPQEVHVQGPISIGARIKLNGMKWGLDLDLKVFFERVGDVERVCMCVLFSKT